MIKYLLIPFRISLVAITLTAAFSLCQPAADAHPLIYSIPSATENGSFDGELPIKQIGPLALPKAIVQFKSTEVNILAVPDWLFDRNLVLSGSLVKAEINVQGKTNTVNGLVYFLKGMWRSSLGSPRAVDIIDTISGERLHGQVMARLDNAFAFKPENGPMRKLAFGEIKNIISPFAYTFIIDTEPQKTISSPNSLQFESTSVSFLSTDGHNVIAKKARVPRSTLAGTEQSISNKEIAAMVGMNIITDLAPAVAIPLSLNAGTVSQAKREIKFYDTTQQRASGIPVPIQY